jgi:hypothetical protein
VVKHADGMLPGKAQDLRALASNMARMLHATSLKLVCAHPTCMQSKTTHAQPAAAHSNRGYYQGIETSQQQSHVETVPAKGESSSRVSETQQQYRNTPDV